MASYSFFALRLGAFGGRDYSLLAPEAVPRERFGATILYPEGGSATKCGNFRLTTRTA